MRDLVIKRIMWLLACNGGSTPTMQPIRYDNMRWHIVAIHHGGLCGIDTSSKKFHKSLSDYQITEQSLQQFADDDLIDLLQLIIVRTYKQM